MECEQSLLNYCIKNGGEVIVNLSYCLWENGSKERSRIRNLRN
jgi:hypothetical protein